MAGSGSVSGEGRLVLCSKPRAALRLYFTIPPEQNGGVTVEKYSTRFGTTFEKHIDAKGITTWYRLLVKSNTPF